MPDPIETANPDEAKPFDVTQVKSLLKLPETATDVEIIQSLVELIAGLQQKYDAVLADAVALEDTVKNRDIEDFKDIITPASKEYWEGQLLSNREAAIATLTELRNSRPAPVATLDPKKEEKKPEPRTPLANREPAAPRSIQQILTGGSADEARSQRILNRAHEIEAEQGIGFQPAFEKAEKEITA
jgi:hypothetical protein